jgi:hypothetical protein
MNSEQTAIAELRNDKTIQDDKVMATRKRHQRRECAKEERP